MVHETKWFGWNLPSVDNLNIIISLVSLIVREKLLLALILTNESIVLKAFQC